MGWMCGVKTEVEDDTISEDVPLISTLPIFFSMRIYG